MMNDIKWDDEQDVTWDEGEVSGQGAAKAVAPSPYSLTDKPGVIEQFAGGAKHAWDRAAAGLQSAAGAVGLPTGESLQPLVASGKQFVKETGPASTVGQIAGDVAMSAPVALKVFKGLNAARGLLPAIAGEAATNAGYSALTADPEDRVSDAAISGGLSVGGSALSKALGAVRRGAKPTAEALQFEELAKQAGSPPPKFLTPGQLAPAGSWLRKGEESLARVPIIGAPIRDRLNEAAIQGFQNVSRQIARPGSAPRSASESIESLKASFDDAYDTALRDKTIDGTAATGYHEMEKLLKAEVNQLLKSPEYASKKAGHELEQQVKAFANQWRSKLSDADREVLDAVDKAYAEFLPIKKASTKTNATLVSPENYTPASVLKETRSKPDLQQAKFARQAESIIGSTAPKDTLGGALFGSSVGIGSLLTGQGLPVATAALTGAGYGTKTGQSIARGAQRALTNDELAAVLDALRRGIPAANRDK